MSLVERINHDLGRVYHNHYFLVNASSSGVLSELDADNVISGKVRFWGYKHRQIQSGETVQHFDDIADNGGRTLLMVAYLAHS